MGAQTENEDFGFVSHTDLTRSLVPSVAQDMDSLGRRVTVLPRSSFLHLKGLKGVLGS